MNRQWLLLAIVGILALLKFVLQPLSEGLAEKREEIVRLQERLHKSQRLVDEVEQLQRQSNEIEAGLEQFRNRFAIAPSAEQARLDFQQKLERKAQQANVDLESLEWTINTSGVPAMSQVNLKVGAKLEEVMRFHSDIANLGYGVTTTEIQLNIRRQLLSRKRLGNVSGGITLQIYYLVENGQS